VAGWVSTQVEQAELGRQRSRAMEAELRALRAQISPHFIYNSLAAIASFVRTDPDRARDLLLEFADFTRYAFRRGGAFTTLAEELGNIEHYLALEQARFGDRLQISLLVAPEVLSVAVPYLAIQPLVENAVRHGLESKEGVGHVSITASDQGSEAEIVVEDDGIGSDPEVVRAVLAGVQEGDSVGLGNVDARLRKVYGDDHGLVVETAPGAGTKVTFRVPKFAPGIRPSS
jgi:two-component system LytT family sensor kinase